MVDEKGREVEDLIEKICTRMFFSDFTVTCPKFRKSNGEEKEIADLLIPFENQLLVFQVKTKQESKKASEKTNVDFKRIEKTVHKALTQFKTTKRAIKNQRFSSLRTARGYVVPFDPPSFIKIIGVVVLDLVGEEVFPQEERTAIFSGFTIEHKMPIHIFMRGDFEAISSEIDTLPDFLKYLNIREQLYSNRLLAPVTEELDLLATYKTNPDLLQDFVSKGENGLIVIDSGIWKYYREELAKQVNKRDWLNQPSYVVDNVIEWLHSSVGFDLGIDVTQGQRDTMQGTVQGYIAVAVELAKIPRLHRRVIGERFLHCMRKADRIGHGHSLILLSQEKSGILVMASSASREDRVQALYNLSAMAYCYKDLEKIVGIASEPLSCKDRSYDVLLFEGVTFQNSQELYEQAQRAFGPQRNVHITEYSERNNSPRYT